MNLKPGKYVGHKFTADQEKARKIWRQAQKREIELHDALKVIPLKDREHLHKRLDQHLDRIENSRERARNLFPEVDESFTISSGTISF